MAGGTRLSPAREEWNRGGGGGGSDGGARVTGPTVRRGREAAGEGRAQTGEGKGRERGGATRAHVTSAGVAPPRSSRWGKGPAGRLLPAHALPAGHAPRQARPRKKGVLKGTVTPTPLEVDWEEELRTDCDGFALSLSVLLLLLFVLFVLFGYGLVLEYCYLQRIGLLSGRLGAFVPAALA